ncbi:MAG: FHA domain-containing protein [Polyangiaceae bacterium]|nr:FHA domain-containing protein [Polyangiaceae bacterium]
MPVRLRYLVHDLEVPPGEFLIGRSPDCQLSLDDPLVSRRHAILVVQSDGVFMEDLGSRNGVVVNGKKISGPTRVRDGDQIQVGSQMMTLIGVPGSDRFTPDSPAQAGSRRGGAASDVITLTGVENEELSAATAESQSHAPAPESPDKRVSSIALIGGLAEKALAMGRADEAERILTRALRDILIKARAGDEVRPELSERAAHYASRLASATGRGLWVDYIFELYALTGTVLPAKLVDELFTVMRKVKSVDKAIIASYTEKLRKNDHLGPGERFIRQRIEGLERLGAMK